MQSMIKKFRVLVGLTSIIAFFAFASSASAAFFVQYSSNGGPWQTANDYITTPGPVTVRATYYEDPTVPPEYRLQFVSYAWHCGSEIFSDPYTTTPGPTVVCSYTSPGLYTIEFQTTTGSASVATVRISDPLDVHRPIRYIGPTTMYRSTVWGIQSPKPSIGASLYGGNGGYSVDTAKCPASMPTGTQCFRLGKNSPTRRSVLIEALAGVSSPDPVNTDKLDQHVQVLRDPSTTRTHKKVGSSCSYGTRLSIPQSVPAQARASAKLEGRLPGKSWRVLARRTVRTYLSGRNRTLNPQVKFNLTRGTVQQYAAKKAAFRFTYASSIGKDINYYQFSKRSKVTARSITRCSF